MIRNPNNRGEREYADADDGIETGARRRLDPGKRTLAQHLEPASAPEAPPSSPVVVQRKASPDADQQPPLDGGLAQAFADVSDSGARVPAVAAQAAAQVGLGDVGEARLHTGADSADAAAAIGARAFTVGRDIHFAAGQYRPGTPDGDTLLGHELAHTVQQQGVPSTPQAKLQISEPGDALETEADSVGAAMAAAMAGSAVGPVPVSRGAATPGTIARDRADGAPATAPATAPVDPGAGEPLEIPADLLSEPGADDVLVAIAAGRMVALPAPRALFLVAPTTQPTSRTPAARPAFTLPTLGKEGLIGVRVGGQLGFLIDAGGRPAVVAPHALAEIRGALGVATLEGVLVTHIHTDHGQSLVTIVETQRIRAENLRVPEAFGVNPAAPSSTLARLLRELNEREDLRALGYGPESRIGTIATPAEGSTFHEQIRRGGVAIDYYGVTEAFQRLRSNRAQGRPQPEADTASLLVRITHEASGARWLYVGDLRGRDLELFRTSLGEARYNEILSGVRTIVGFQHHLGATRPADMDGLVDLLQRVQMQGGRLRILAQSQEEFAGRQFLNRPLIRALTEMGIDVEVAMEPAPGGGGSITVDTAGEATHRGGRTESFAGSPAARAQFERLARLREADEALARYGHHLRRPIADPAQVRTARQTLESALPDFIDGTLRNIDHGAAARRQGELRDPGAQQRSLDAVSVHYPVEDELTPARMEQVRELQRMGPHLDTFERARVEARTTGRIPDYGIEALWEIDPTAAQRLLRDSGLPRRTRRVAAAQVPGAPVSGGTSLIGAGLLIVEVTNLAAPIIVQERENAFNTDIRDFLDVILWWQSKGVVPRMEGVEDGFFGNTRITDPADLSQLLAERDLDYLAMPGLPDDETAWDGFRIWATVNLRSYRDFLHHVMNDAVSRTTLRQRSATHLVAAEWEYRASRVATPWYGHDVQSEWKTNPHLTRTLRACAQAAVGEAMDNVPERADTAGSETVPRLSAPGQYTNRETFGELPAATGTWRFRPGVEPTLFSLRDLQPIPAAAWYALYSFPPEVAARHGAVPEGYIVVGGGDIITYEAIVTGPNIVNAPLQTPSGPLDHSRTTRHNQAELLLARRADLVRS